MGNAHRLSPRKKDEADLSSYNQNQNQNAVSGSGSAGNRCCSLPEPQQSNGNYEQLQKQKSLSSTEDSGGGGGCSIPQTPSQHSIRQRCETPDTEAVLVGFYTLNVFQRRLLKQKWQNVNKVGTGGIGNLVFQKLLAKESCLRELFQKAEVVEVFNKETTCNSLSAHIKLFVDILDEAVYSLDDLDAVGEKCVQYGEAHCCLNGLGFEANLWDVFGQAFIEAITSLDAIRRHRELVRAWRILASFIVDKIRQGYENGVRRRGLIRQTSTFSVPDADGSQET